MLSDADCATSLHHIRPALSIMFVQMSACRLCREFGHSFLGSRQHVTKHRAAMGVLTCQAQGRYLWTGSAGSLPVLHPIQAETRAARSLRCCATSSCGIPGPGWWGSSHSRSGMRFHPPCRRRPRRHHKVPACRQPLALIRHERAIACADH